jgi:kynurenine formamidase
METMTQSVVHELVAALFAVLIGALTALIGFVADKYRLERFGLKREQLVADMRGIVLAQEERVEALAKKGAISIAKKGDAKLEGALAIFLDKHPGITREEADHLAHEAIATVGVGSADFLGKLLRASRAGA